MKITIEEIVEKFSSWKHPGVVYSSVCLQCFEVYFTFAKQNGGYCSYECHNVARRVLSAGETRKDKDGYLIVKGEYSHPRASNGQIREHTVVMEKHLGRYLTANENVHHKNGIRDDNRIENLELWVTYQPYGQRVEDLIKFVVSNYEKEIRTELAAK